LYNCALTPPEWIAAHGFTPRRVVAMQPRPHATTTYDGCCAVATALIHTVTELALRPDPQTNGQAIAAVVIATTCDQIRRAAEELGSTLHTQHPTAPPVLWLHWPATWQTAAAQRLYRQELRRLGTALVRLGGAAPSKPELTRVMLEHQERRAALCAQAPHLTGRQRAAAFAQYHGDLEGAPEPDTPAAAALRSHQQDGVPLGLLGAEMPRDQWWLYDAIEAHGGRVALDAGDDGERGLPQPFEGRLLHDDPLEALAAAYFDQPPLLRQRPNTPFHAWLKNALQRRPLRGLIVRRTAWCDLWLAELPRIKASTGLPMLDLDLDAADAPARAAGRIAAFLEMLR
jgi:benzoyl-CoA reductase/2-hydroxyglutaryl-CoA dehydratase subunit BcrC/BadD/HgdB